MPQHQGRWVALTPLPSSQSAAFALVIGSVAVLAALLSNKPGASFILSIRDNMLASMLPSWVTGQLQRLAALRVPSADIPASASVICHKGAIRDLPAHAFAVLEGRAFSELRRGCDFVAYNGEAFRRLLGPQPVIRELHARSDAFAHEVSKCCHCRRCAQPPAPPVDVRRCRAGQLPCMCRGSTVGIWCHAHCSLRSRPCGALWQLNTVVAEQVSTNMPVALPSAALLSSPVYSCKSASAARHL